MNEEQTIEVRVGNITYMAMKCDHEGLRRAQRFLDFMIVMIEMERRLYDAPEDRAAHEVPR